MFSTLISSHQIFDLTRLHLLLSWSLRQQNYSSVILLPHASESRSSIRVASVLMIDALRCWRFNSVWSKKFLIRSIHDRCHKLKSNRVASSMWRHNVIKFFAVSLRVRFMVTSKIIFDECDQDRCVTRRFACLSSRHINSLRSSVISRNTSPRTFPSTEKVFRRAALTLLRRNHAARVAGARRHSVPIRSCGCRSATWFENPRIPRFAPDTRGVPPRWMFLFRNIFLSLILTRRFGLHFRPRFRAHFWVIFWPLFDPSFSTLFLTSFWSSLLLTLFYSLQLIIITSLHHQLTSSHHIIKSSNRQHTWKCSFWALFWPLEKHPFFDLFLTSSIFITQHIIDHHHQRHQHIIKDLKITFFSFF